MTSCYEEGGRLNYLWDIVIRAAFSSLLLLFGNAGIVYANDYAISTNLIMSGRIPWQLAVGCLEAGLILAMSRPMLKSK